MRSENGIAGGLVEAFDQDAWGNVLSSIETGAWAATFDGRHLTTKEYDGDAGMYYFWQRWYGAEEGRFISEDPLESEGNLYRLSRDNPVILADPSGLMTVSGGSCPAGYVIDQCWVDTHSGQYICHCKPAPSRSPMPILGPPPDSDGDGTPDSEDVRPNDSSLPIRPPGLRQRICGFPKCFYDCVQSLSPDLNGNSIIGLYRPIGVGMAIYEIAVLDFCANRCDPLPPSLTRAVRIGRSFLPF